MRPQDGPQTTPYEYDLRQHIENLELEKVRIRQISTHGGGSIRGQPEAGGGGAELVRSCHQHHVVQRSGR